MWPFVFTVMKTGCCQCLFNLVSEDPKDLEASVNYQQRQCVNPVNRIDRAIFILWILDLFSHTWYYKLNFTLKWDGVSSFCGNFGSTYVAPLPSLDSWKWILGMVKGNGEGLKRSQHQGLLSLSRASSN